MYKVFPRKYVPYTGGKAQKQEGEKLHSAFSGKDHIGDKAQKHVTMAY